MVLITEVCFLLLPFSVPEKTILMFDLFFFLIIPVSVICESLDQIVNLISKKTIQLRVSMYNTVDELSGRITEGIVMDILPVGLNHQ